MRKKKSDTNGVQFFWKSDIDGVNDATTISISRKKNPPIHTVSYSAKGIYHALCMEISEFNAMAGNITVASFEADFHVHGIH